MKTQALIAEARGRITAGDPAAALPLLESLVERITRNPPDEAEAESLRGALATLHSLAAAALEGHGRARETIAELLANAGVLKTYDPSGKEEIHATSRRGSGKINQNF